MLVLASAGLAWAAEASELAVWASETPLAVAWEPELGRERA